MSPPPRSVAVVVNDLEAYGSQIVATRLAGAISQMVPDTVLITLNGASPNDLVLPDHLPHKDLARTSHGAMGYAQTVWRLRRELSALKPDLVISHMLMSNVTALSALRPVRSRAPEQLPRVLVTEHNRPSLNLALERSAGPLRHLATRLYPRATRVIGVSDAVVEDVCQTYRVDASLGRRIYNPVDLERVRRDAAVPAPHPWLTRDPDWTTVVCVGAFRVAKGQDILIRALAEAPDTRVIFVGEGKLEGEARQLAAKLGVEDRTAFAGYRADAPAFIAHADVLVVPSRWEGFGLVAVEAAALGIPVVAAAVSGLSELVPTRVPGILVPAEDPRALANALTKKAWESEHKPPDLSEFDPTAVAASYLSAAGYGSCGGNT